MARTVTKVPFGYEPEKETIRGTLFVYDAFPDTYTQADLQSFTGWADGHDLAQVVMYPIHEETVRRMVSKSAAASIEPYHVRLQRLEEMCSELQTDITVEIDEWERKRKKYTPMDSALDFLTEKYRSPHFLGLSGTTANQFAAYKSFEPWIRKLRLLIQADESFHLHPQLIKFENRWDLL